MLKAEIKQENLQQIIDSLFLVDEVMINISEDGFTTRAIDEAAVAKVELTVNSSAFEKYEATSRTLGVSLESLQKVVNKSEKGDMIHLKLVEEEKTLKVRISEHEYYLTLIDPRTMEQPGSLPDLEGSLQVSLAADNFQKGVRAAKTFSDKMTFRTNSENKLILESSGDDNKTRTTFSEEHFIESNLGTADSAFGLGYLDGIQQALNDTSSIRLAMGVDRPAHMEFDIAGGAGRVQYFIAPRVRNN
ncbi:hypothetical protein HYG81_00710 [Natrinema zhouii]|uniref:DNA polymerase sliding clamp n=1 Tax=Natrinema zhouii TaxID=1710539 RepID=A0A7D6GKJ8_9EURY|nr:hypothetical protein [Natrinema zhouii]QLK26180.1 hypothetical protein HYG81_00710 [Natrinema zhouii]